MRAAPRDCAPNSYIATDEGSNDFWSTSFDVDAEHNGNVMFLLKTRVLDCDEEAGTVVAQLKLDDNLVGSFGIQQLNDDDVCHQRTITASYLALGLSTGTHTIEGNIDVTGLSELAISGDLGLVFSGN